ncbi:MAG: terpene cyclase/mutase family protein, partial [Planctomycetes bacterium]|nr:terpene cyclase/mutase family protein [Planctomycetota bacterium]
SSGRRDSGRLRCDLPESASNAGPTFVSATQPSQTQSTRDERLDAAIAQTRDYLLAQQNEEGYWVGELEGDTILESEYILLLAFLDREKSEIATQAAHYILEKQLPEGGWASYPGGPLEISASVKAYFALKLTGHSADASSMQRARSAILEAGGAEKINSFTRYYLALLGVIRYEQCPAVPPELILIPNWMPFNIYEMSAWSRTIVIPLSLLWAYRPDRAIPDEHSIRELFVDEPEKLPMCMGASAVLDEMPRKTWIDWNRFFNRLDRFLKFLERCRLRPFRKLAVRRAADWILKRFENSDGLGAIFPPIIWSVIALKCLGYDDESPEVQSALGELEKLTIREGDTARLEPCKAPVWDTALTTLALRDAELPVDHPAVRRAVDWLLSKEVRSKGDWSQLKNKTDVGGWFFEFKNEFYPDLDDTSMVVMALCRSLPAAGKTGWSAEFLLEDWSPHEADKDAAAILSTQDATAHSAFRDVEMLTPQLTAIRRGVRWILAMQSSDGGWGAFDADNNRELFTQVPFADHNAMIDPSTADLTARMLEMFSYLNIPGNHPALQHARNFVWNEQEQDGCWYGRWGVNYLYGTWQSLVGLIGNGVPVTDQRIQKAANWLKSKQQPSGAWGETPRSYDDPTLRGQGEPTASQTAWALMGLMAAGETDSPAVRRGIQYLLETQCEDGSWNEEWFTGTGFPRVFYLKYHLYRIYFPLMALSRYARLRSAEA